MELIPLYIIIFLFGITIGSFLNVCIYRIPERQNIVTVRSHCMSCGYTLKWYDLIPLFSFLALGGRCRKCKAKLSVQYPLIEALNGSLYLAVFSVYGLSVESLLYCLLFSALLLLSVIDFRTYEIPAGINAFILTLGLARIVTDPLNWTCYAAGFLSVSAFLLLIYVVTKGRGIGGGDIKLMAACGAVIGWKLTIFAFFTACVLGAVCHLIRMKVSGAGHVLALGPYLSLGVAVAVLWGNPIINWYFSSLGF